MRSCSAVNGWYWSPTNPSFDVPVEGARASLSNEKTMRVSHIATDLHQLVLPTSFPVGPVNVTLVAGSGEQPSHKRRGALAAYLIAQQCQAHRFQEIVG
jgi:hypothetical protein